MNKSYYYSKCSLLEQLICRLLDREYKITDEHILEYLKVPIGDRLRMLEELEAFIFHTLPPEKWEILQRIRRGEI